MSRSSKRQGVSNISHYAVVETQLKDRDALLAALQEMNTHWLGNVEVHEDAVSLYGYHGDVRPEKAHLVIRRQHVSGSSNDIGFVRGANGNYGAIISDFDRSIGYNEAWLKRLTQAYAKNVVRKEASRQGYRITGETKREDGSIRMVIEVP